MQGCLPCLKQAFAAPLHWLNTTSTLWLSAVLLLLPQLLRHTLLLPCGAWMLCMAGT
jgi:hypothetical protein